MANIEDLIAQISPQWRPQGPTGGYIASELKKIHDDSLSVFPESVYNGEAGGKRAQRWRTTMKSDFIPIDQLKAIEARKFAVKAKMGNAPEDDCGVAGTLGGGLNSMFQSWKVPSRLTDRDSRCDTRASVNSVANDLAEMRIESARADNTGLPLINGATPRQCTVQSVASLRPTFKATRSRKQPKSLAAKTLFDQYHSKDERSTSERWLAQASESDINMMEKAMKMGKPRPRDDVEAPVKQWLDDASPKEREVALTFFKSLAGTQLMGGTQDKKERMDQVVSLLQNPPNKYDSGAGNNLRTLNSSGKSLKYVKLLSPSARKNKWRHQTWHNLPSYPNRSKVLNKSSILIAPHSTVHRHFTIHPDWGP